MGAAKRRKRAGAYPEGGPVKEFRVPRGKLAITVDVPGTDPSTILFDTDKIAAVVEAVERQPGRPSYRDLVMALAKEFAACKRRGGDLAGIGVGILWSVLNHPQSGSAMRASVSSA